MGLDARKMSKSYNNTINLSDSSDLVTKKIAGMFTDPKSIKLADKGHSDSCNVFSYYSTFVPGMRRDVHDWCSNAKVGCTECKKVLAEKILEMLRPIHLKREELIKDKEMVKKVLTCGRDKALALSSTTIKEVKRAMRF